MEWSFFRVVGLSLLTAVGRCQAADAKPVVQPLLVAHVATPLVITEKDLTIDGALGSFSASWTVQSPEPNLILATLTLTAPQPATVPPFSVKWNVPAVDLAGIWVSDNTKPNNDHQGMAVEARAVLRAPLLMTLGPDDNNRMTIALSDALRPSKIRCSVREEDVKMCADVKLFATKQPPLKKYQVTFRIDTRTVPYYKVLRDTAQWWAAQEGYAPAPVPEAARVPLYSTWYSYHQSVDPATIINECRLGGELGLEGVIVDDGWQTLDSSRGYAFTGDWKPERIPEMKKFVDGVHALNQKFMLWYSVPMAGEKSIAAKRFEGKTLGFSNSLRAHTLDPRYPEVREYLIGLYENAVREWGIDGLKLDFIELFSPKADTVLTAENGRDIASVDEAVDRLFTDIMARLRKIKPDIAIEFRQPYNGPLMRKYGNMLRGVDCPNAGPVNRKEIIDLRLLADHTAVHSDMIVWHPSEPVASAALQLLNVLFSVPQVSVRLAEVSPEHRKMIGFWLHYWKENRATLLDGELQPVSPAANYPLVLARSSDKLIAALYQDMVIVPGPQMPSQIDVVNAKPSPSVVLRFEKVFGPATVRIRDCQGKQISKQSQVLGVGATTWEVPPSGLLEIRDTETQVVSITGKIVDRAGRGVKNGIVELVGTTFSTRSNAAGEFSLKGESPGVPPAVVKDKIQLNINCPGCPLRTLTLSSTQLSLGEIKIFAQPNFVIIFTDDQGYADLGTFGSGTAPSDGNWLPKDRIAIPTPRIDKMAEEGLKFTSFYAQTYCGPSRAQLMTGCYAARVARKGNTKGARLNGLFNGSGGIDVDPSEITIAEVLKAAGYATGMVGKWHLGIDPGYKPVNQGFDYWWGARYSNDSGSVPLYENETSLGSYDDMAHVTRDYTLKALKWMKEHKDKPFFMWIAHTMPHKKIAASEKFKGTTKRGLYGDVISELDFYTGMILDSIRDWGLDDNTIVIFLSDNGHWGGAEDAGTGYPLRAGKLSQYEGGYRVPCVVRAPGIIPPGSVNAEMVTSMDLMPTFVKLAGGKMPADRIIDGKDIEDLLRMKPGAVSPHKVHYFYKTTTLQAVRWGKWKLHIVYNNEEIGPAELYDLQTDIGESQNVASSNPDVVDKIMEFAKAGIADIGDFFHVGKGERRVQ